MSNKSDAANSATPLWLTIEGQWRRVADLGRSTNMQDELAKFDALKGQIYTSPGQAQRRPGLRTQNDLSLFFQSGLAHRAKPDWKKRELGCEVSFTQGGGPACAPLRRALPWAITVLSPAFGKKTDFKLRHYHTLQQISFSITNEYS